MDASDPTIAQLATVSGNAAITFLIGQVFWRTANAAPATMDRFGPVTAVAIAVGLAVAGSAVNLTAALSSADLLQSVLVGVVSGTSAIGIHDLVKTRAGA